jgi:hypothetical protein
MVNTGDIFDESYKNKMPFVKQRLNKNASFYSKALHFMLEAIVVI